MNKTISLLAFIATFILGSVWVQSFFQYVIPIVYPIFVEGRFWAIWLVVGIFVSPLMLLIIYVSMKATNFHFKHWKSSIIVSAASFIILSAMAYLFSQVLSPDLELFRSITLPTLVLALAFVVFSRTKYGKRHEY